MALIKCLECGVGISGKAKKCPQCGHPVKKKTPASAWVLLIIAGFVIYGASKGDKEIDTGKTTSLLKSLVSEDEKIGETLKELRARALTSAVSKDGNAAELLEELEVRTIKRSCEIKYKQHLTQITTCISRQTDALTLLDDYLKKNSDIAGNPSFSILSDAMSESYIMVDGVKGYDWVKAKAYFKKEMLDWLDSEGKKDYELSNL